MRFKKLDLNLLVALDVLLRERSVTRAAEELNLSPSAVSNALARLREYFDDELLVQIGRKLEPTPRAESLQEAVREVLVRIDSTVAAQPAFEPQVSDRRFRILASDYTQFAIAPGVLALAAKERSRVSFDFMAQVNAPHRELERGDADLLIVPTHFMSPDHPRELLQLENFVCVVWRDSALAKGDLTFQRYIDAEHAVMQPSAGNPAAFEGWFLQRFGVTRNVTVTTYSFVTLPMLVVGTERIATVHERIARRLVHVWPLEIRPTPIPFEKMEQSMQWHKFRTNDPGLSWLRGLFTKAAQQVDPI